MNAAPVTGDLVVSDGLLGWLLSLMTGYHSVGPVTVARDRFDSSKAISESWKRQTLLNIVKLRYLDPPIFADAGPIVDGCVLQTGASAGFPETNAIGGNQLSIGGASSFTDRPTITYVPLAGTKFINSLITPLPPAALFRAIEAGWPADAILTLGIANINGLNGETNGATGSTRPDERFARVGQLMRSLQLSGLVSIRIAENEAKKQATLVTLCSDAITDELVTQASELRALLGLDQKATEFRLVHGSLAANDHEIAVTPRSLIHVMGMLSAHVMLPPDEVAEGRAAPGVGEDEMQGMRFYSGKEAPGDAFAAVHYRSRWFWIDERDLTTKRAFTLILLLFTLADAGGTEGMPLPTIPTS